MEAARSASDCSRSVRLCGWHNLVTLYCDNTVTTQSQGKYIKIEQLLLHRREGKKPADLFRQWVLYSVTCTVRYNWVHIQTGMNYYRMKTKEDK